MPVARNRLLFQCEKWTDNPDQFVEEEDEDSFSYSVRISSQDLLLVRCPDKYVEKLSKK